MKSRGWRSLFPVCLHRHSLTQTSHWFLAYSHFRPRKLKSTVFNKKQYFWIDWLSYTTYSSTLAGNSVVHVTRSVGRARAHVAHACCVSRIRKMRTRRSSAEQRNLAWSPPPLPFQSQTDNERTRERGGTSYCDSHSEARLRDDDDETETCSVKKIAPRLRDSMSRLPLSLLRLFILDMLQEFSWNSQACIEYNREKVLVRGCEKFLPALA